MSLAYVYYSVIVARAFLLEYIFLSPFPIGSIMWFILNAWIKIKRLIILRKNHRGKTFVLPVWYYLGSTWWFQQDKSKKLRGWVGYYVAAVVMHQQEKKNTNVFWCKKAGTSRNNTIYLGEFCHLHYYPP